MTLRKIIRIIVALLLIITMVVGVTLIKHPIILKWLAGSARIIGRPINATVYSDGVVNKDIQVYHVCKNWNSKPADYYLLHFTYAYQSRLKFLSLNIKDNYAGAPGSTSIEAYDIIAGFLFQSEIGSRFTALQNDIKGFDFDPRFTFTEKEIRLRIPPTAKELKCDSIRVVL